MEEIYFINLSYVNNLGILMLSKILYDTLPFLFLLEYMDKFILIFCLAEKALAI